MWVSLDGAAMRIPVHVPWVSEHMGRFQWVGFPWTPLLGGGVKKHRKVASGDSSSVEAGKGKSQFVLGCWQGLWKDERVKWDKT